MLVGQIESNKNNKVQDHKENVQNKNDTVQTMKDKSPEPQQ